MTSPAGVDEVVRRLNLMTEDASCGLGIDWYRKVATEAADLLTAQAAENQKLRNEVMDGRYRHGEGPDQEGPTALERLATAEAEAQKLRAELTGVWRAVGVCETRIKELLAERTTLRAERDDTHAALVRRHKDLATWQVRANKAEAERDKAVERLSEVFEFATVTDSGMKGCTYALHLSDGIVSDARAFIANHGASDE